MTGKYLCIPIMVRKRLRKIESLISHAKKENINIDVEALVSQLIVNDAVSRRTALEEINAVMRYLDG